MSALGTALLAFTVVAGRPSATASRRSVDWLRRAGQMSLSIYIAHALVFCLLVDWLDIVSPGGIATSLAFALSYWLISTIAAVAYHKRFGQRPRRVRLPQTGELTARQHRCPARGLR